MRTHFAVPGAFLGLAQLFSVGCYLAHDAGPAESDRGSSPGSVSDSHRDVAVGPSIAALPPAAGIAPGRARATSVVHIAMNLDSDAETVPPFDPDAPYDTCNASSAVTVYDGTECGMHQIDVLLRRADVNRWEWYAVRRDPPGSSHARQLGGSGVITFVDGRVAEPSSVETSGAFVPGNPAQRIVFDFGPWTDSRTGSPDRR